MGGGGVRKRAGATHGHEQNGEGATSRARKRHYTDPQKTPRTRQKSSETEAEAETAPEEPTDRGNKLAD